ncbi:hypothetical protein BGZ58_000301 [Dissophora ornata]|nr:hypothetical protein BGZ58_000301 [Dissophora ornata]
MPHNGGSNTPPPPPPSLESLGPLEPAVSLLDPNVQYLAYLPFGGLTNQFMALENALFVAKELNRTLIIPPVIANTHVHDNTHQRWSQYMDLPKLTNLTGIPVVEWDFIRPLTPAQKQAGREQAMKRMAHVMEAETESWSRVAENVTTHVVYGYGAPGVDINHSGLYFAWHFLFRMVCVEPKPLKPGMTVYNRTEVTGETTRMEDLIVMDDLLQRYADDDSHTLWFSHTFKLKDVGHRGRYWDEIGKNLHFVPKLMEYATKCLNEELERDVGVVEMVNDDPEEIEDPLLDVPSNMTGPMMPNTNVDASESGELTNPETFEITAPVLRVPHIAVHLRRGDIGSKCTVFDMDSCMVPFEFYVDAVARGRTEAARRGLVSHLPVVVTTDSTNENDLQQIRSLGWHRVDHDKFDTVRLWGPFGAAMVDSAILAHADQFVGSGRSTMTRIAALRQEAWYGRKTVYPIITHQKPNTKRRLMAEELADDVRVFY